MARAGEEPDSIKADVSKESIEEPPRRKAIEKTVQAEEETLESQPLEESLEVDIPDVITQTTKEFDESDRQEAVVRQTAVDEKSLNQAPEEVVTAPEETPEHRLVEGHVELAPRDAMLQAITEFDELVRETEKTLEREHLETDARDRITKAIGEATKLIKKAFEKDPIEGGEQKHTAKAVRKAAKLIEDALEQAPTRRQHGYV